MHNSNNNETLSVMCINMHLHLDYIQQKYMAALKVWEKEGASGYSKKFGDTAPLLGSLWPNRGLPHYFVLLV